MKILVFSDVHGNLPAFEQMLKNEKDIESYICLGDLVNYGPWSNECVELAISLRNITLIMGNHEEAFINGNYDGDNKLVHQFFDFTYPHFKMHHIIKSFVNSYNLNNFTFTHTLYKKYIYSNLDIVLNHNYVIGHSHEQFKMGNSGFVLYNVGSVGQNRSDINRIDYLIIDFENAEFTFKQLFYPVKIVINEMIFRRYPVNCIEYYLNKLNKRNQYEAI